MNFMAKAILGMILLGGVSIIVAANFQRPAGSFQFKWDLHREVPTEVRLDPAQIGTIVHSVSAPGDIEADIEVSISAQVLGRITSLPVREGERVKKDQLVVKLDSVDFEAQVKSAEARVQRLRSAIESSEADLEKAERDLNLNRALFEKRAINRSAVQDLETLLTKGRSSLAMVKAELREAEAMLAKAKEDLLDTTLRSPIDGVVSRLDAEEGETVVVGTMNQPGTVIMTISDMNTMVVRARVDETDIPLVKPGQPALIHVQYNEDAPLRGKVLRIAPKGIKGGSNGSASLATAAVAANPNDVAIFETIISIDNPPEQIQLGMTANVDIQVDERAGVLTIPSQAVLHRRVRDLPRRLAEAIEKETPDRPGMTQPKMRYYQCVYIDNDGLVECRLVKTGVSDETRVEILEGLKEGDRVISGPYRVFDKLREGKPIKEMAGE